MISSVSIVKSDLRPADIFAAEWRQSAASQGLPRWMDIVTPEGKPTGKFARLCMVAFALDLSAGLSVATPIINTDPDPETFGTPTVYMLNKWQAWNP